MVEKEKEVKPEDQHRENLGSKRLIAKDLGVPDEQLKDLNSEELSEIITYYQTKKNAGTPVFFDPNKKVGDAPGVIPPPADPATVPPEKIATEERFNAAMNKRHPVRGQRWNDDAILLMIFDDEGGTFLF
jgi:hypothetical protein